MKTTTTFAKNSLTFQPLYDFANAKRINWSIFILGGAYTGRSLAWDKGEAKDNSADNWLHKRKDYSRHLHPKQRKQPAAKKSSLHANTSGHDTFRRPSEQYGHANRRHDFKHSDSGVEVDRLGRHDSIEELYINEETADHFQSRNLRQSQKQWKSEFVICGPALDPKRTSNGADLDLSSWSLNGSLKHKNFSETIRGFWM